MAMISIRHWEMMIVLLAILAAFFQFILPILVI